MSLVWPEKSLGWPEMSLVWPEMSLVWPEMSLVWPEITVGQISLYIDAYACIHTCTYLYMTLWHFKILYNQASLSSLFEQVMSLASTTIFTKNTLFIYYD